MSLICFRGRPILPPLINDSNDKYDSQAASSIQYFNENCDGHMCQDRHGCPMNDSKRRKEEAELLSLPTCAALSVLLPGLKDVNCKGFDSKLPDANIMRDCVAEPNNENKPSGCVLDNTLIGASIQKKCNPSTSYIEKLEEENSVVQVNGQSTVDRTEGTTSLSISCASSQVSDDETQIDGDLDLEDGLEFNQDDSKTDYQSVCTSDSPRSLSCISSQKIESLKDRRDSSQYLEDYLQLLTSTQSIAKVDDSSVSTTPLTHDRRSSVPSMNGNHKVRHRNHSGNSDKGYRSLGSNYMDNYLVTLTDFSWIIYPTEPKVPSNSAKAVTFDLEPKEVTSVPAAPSGSPNYLRRKLRFLDPEKFFYKDQDKSKSGSLSKTSNLSFEEDCDSHKTVDCATSPDISSSIFDRDNDDTLISSCSNKLSEKNDSPKSDVETFEIFDLEQSNLSENSNSSSGVTSLSNTIENSSSSIKDKSEEKQNYDSSSGVSSQPETGSFISERKTETKESSVDVLSEASETVDHNINVPINGRFPKLMTSFHSGGRMRIESKIDEESSSSSEISSATEPSTIVLAGEQSIGASDYEQTSLSSDLGKSLPSSKVTNEAEYLKSIEELRNAESKVSQVDRPSSSTSDNVPDDSLGESNDASPNDPKLTFMIDMLKAKQQREVDELKKKHEQELRNFESQLQQLSETQVLMLTSAYNSPNNNTLNELLELNTSMHTSLTKSMTDSTGTNSSLPNDNSIVTTLSDIKNDSHLQTSFQSTSQSTATTPSFFLHNDNGNKTEPENSKISQIFSSARTRNARVPQSITDLLHHHPQLLASQTQSDTNGCYADSSNSSPSPTCNSVRESIPQGSATPKEGNKKDKLPVLLSKVSLEAGLDLVPARESDLASLYNKVLQPKHYYGICKLQAIIRGGRVRKLMKTAEIQQLTGTLKEVVKLSYQFHQDILTDNIKKGDVEFHRALFSQEQQTRDKLHQLLIETTPSQQLKMIRKDRLTRDASKVKKQRIPQPRISSGQRSDNSSVKTVASKMRAQVLPTPHASFRSTVSSSPQRGRMMKQVTARMVSEPPRLCRATGVASSPRKPSLSPRTRGSSIPTPKTAVTSKIKCAPKKTDSKTQTNYNGKIPNAHLCKTELAIMNKNPASKLNGPRAEQFHSRKPWR